MTPNPGSREPVWAWSVQKPENFTHDFTGWICFLFLLIYRVFVWQLTCVAVGDVCNKGKVGYDQLRRIMNVLAVMFPTLCECFFSRFDRTLWSLLVQRAGFTSSTWQLPLQVKQIHPVSTSSCPLMTRSRSSPNISLPTPKSSLLVISVSPGFTFSYIIPASCVLCRWIWLQRVHVCTVDGDGRSELVVGYTDRVVRAFRWEEPSDSSDLGSGQLVLLKKWLLEGQVHFTSELTNPVYTWFKKNAFQWSKHKWTADTHRRSHLCLSCVSKVSSWPFCGQISLLPTSLLLEGQRAPCTVIISVCRQISARFVLHGLAKKTGCYRCWDWQDEVICDFLKRALDKMMTWFPVTSLSGMHQDALAFTLQKICGQTRLRPPRKEVWVIGSQCVSVVVYTCI